MFQKLVQTEDDLAVLVARLALGIVILPHGAQKLLGWFGGGGFSATMAAFGNMGMPAVITFLIIMGESFGSLSLILGFLGRFCAASIGLIQLGALSTVHLKQGFFMNWSGQKQGEGFEFHLLAIGLALVVAIKGSGKWSIDRLLAEKT